MLSVYLRTTEMLFIIAIGYLGKRREWLSAKDARVLSKIVINVTLPCVIIRNLNGIVISTEMQMAILMGFLANLLLVLAAIAATRKQTPEIRCICLFSVPLFNISSYAVPVAQAFVSEREIAALLLFNIPTTIFAYVIVPALVKIMYRTKEAKEKADLQIALKNLCKNIPAVVSITMTSLCVFQIALPSELTSILFSFSSANTALAMLSIGLLFELPNRASITYLSVIILRLACVSALALVIYIGVPPLGSLRNVMILVLFAPMVSSTSAMALEAGYRGSGMALVNSGYLPVSVASMALISGALFQL